MNAITRREGVPGGVNETTALAQQDTVLAPRFYTTDFAAMSRVNVDGVRAEWDSADRRSASGYQP